MSTLSIMSPLVDREIKINWGNGHKKSARSAHSHCIDLSLLGEKKKSLILEVWKPAFTAGLTEMKPGKLKNTDTVVTRAVLLS